MYLATVLDLHTHEIAGHAMAEHMRAELVCDAIDLAVSRGLTSTTAIFHSDRFPGLSRAPLNQRDEHGTRGNIFVPCRSAVRNFFLYRGTRGLRHRTVGPCPRGTTL